MNDYTEIDYPEIGKNAFDRIYNHLLTFYEGSYVDVSVDKLNEKDVTFTLSYIAENDPHHFNSNEKYDPPDHSAHLMLYDDGDVILEITDLSIQNWMIPSLDDEDDFIIFRRMGVLAEANDGEYTLEDDYVGYESYKFTFTADNIFNYYIRNWVDKIDPELFSI